MSRNTTDNRPLQAGFQHENHKRPSTRREFLAQGLLSGGAMAMGSSLLGLLGTNNAYAAADCGISVTPANKIPFLCFDLAGGANIAGSNVIVGGAGGQMDLLPPEAYSKLGLPASMTPDKAGQINTELGLAFHADSAFLRGIISKTSVATRANINGSIICSVSENDTDNNPHNPMYGINRAGANGELIKLIGTQSSESGGRSRAPAALIDPTARPTKIANERDARGLVDTGKLLTLLNQEDAVRVMESIERLSALKVTQIREEQLVKDMLGCSYLQTKQKVARYGNPSLLDAQMDPLITGQADSIFLNNEISDGDFRKTAAVMKLVLNGYAGAGTIEMGGFDYHDNTRATGELRDFKAGQAIGAALEYAARKNRPLMLYVFSDGSVSSSGEIDESADGRGKGRWRNDSASTSSAFFLAYNPNGRPKLRSAASNQIGYFRPNGSVETTSSPAGNNVNLLVEMVVLNYLSLHNETGKFAQVLPKNGLGPSGNWDKFVAMQPIV